jgi:CheY-like chemotaxis protein
LKFIMPETILIVEDEPALRDTLSYNLKKDGFTVEAVGDGRAAVDSARALKPDLIILDIMLPELDGLEVARIIRKEMNTPILMLTARDELHAAARLLADLRRILQRARHGGDGQAGHEGDRLQGRPAGARRCGHVGRWVMRLVHCPAS